MKLVVALFLFSFAAAPATNSQERSVFEVDTGNDFYSTCGSIERGSEGNVSPSDAFKGTYCSGYVLGLIHGITVGNTSKEMLSCVPSPQLSNLQAIRVVRKYIADHPETAHEYTAVLAVQAFSKAFPCKK